MCSPGAVRGPRAALLKVAWALISALGGCRARGSVEEPPPPLVLCVVPLAVTVGGAATDFGWSPGCGATYLEVVSADGPAVQWIVSGDSAKFGPVVRYGVAPRGSAARFGPQPLLPGAAYTVRVGIMVGEDSWAMFGERGFVR